VGTQQILLIVVGVIVVGIAVAVAIAMFNAQAMNFNRQAILSDMNLFASSAIAFYKSPSSHGGGGYTWGVLADLGSWLGYDYTGGVCTTGNGAFTISTSGDVLTIVGLGTELGNDGSANVTAQLLLTGPTSETVVSVIN